MDMFGSNFGRCRRVGLLRSVYLDSGGGELI